jgi:lysosomal Pro-X carboxypeptidase
MRYYIFLLCFIKSLSLETKSNYAKTAAGNYNLFYFNVSIDHYAPNSPSFQLKYYINANYWNGQGPIFLYCGGGKAIETYMSNTGYLDSLASTLNAVVVYAEHRYFGTSLPFGNSSYSSTSNLKYLSPHQAIADFAQLGQYLIFEYSQSPVIAWGGGYEGMLAAWFRMKFPHIVTGAIASSASIFQFNGTVDPNEYSRLVTYHFSVVGGPECPAVIKTAFDILESWMNNITYYYQLELLFNTCEDIITPSDVLSIMDWLYTAFDNMAQSDYPTASTLFNPLPPNPVSVACGLITSNINTTDPVQILQAVINGANVYYNSTGNLVCNELDPSVSSVGFEYEGQSYLRCTTLSRPVGSNGVTDMFWNNLWDQSVVDSKCLQTWNVATQVNYVKLWYGTSTNITYILRHASNIVFSSGSFDPWLAGSVTSNNNRNIIAYIMPGASHQADLRTPNANDPQEVKNGRTLIKQAITYWVTGSAS